MIDVERILQVKSIVPNIDGTVELAGQVDDLQRLTYD